VVETTQYNLFLIRVCAHAEEEFKNMLLKSLEQIWTDALSTYMHIISWVGQDHDPKLWGKFCMFGHLMSFVQHNVHIMHPWIMSENYILLNVLHNRMQGWKWMLV
jgi:hypothetical protein